MERRAGDEGSGALDLGELGHGGVQRTGDPARGTTCAAANALIRLAAAGSTSDEGRPPTLDPFLGAGVPGLVPAAGPAFAPAPNTPVRPRTPPVPPDRSVPGLHEVVAVPAGVYRLGEPGEERDVAVGPVGIGRYPVVNAHVRAFVARPGARWAGRSPLGWPPRSSPTTRRRRSRFADALAFCAWAGGAAADRRRVGGRGGGGGPWPWGETFDPERCNCAEAGWGWTAPVRAHPGGAARAAPSSSPATCGSGSPTAAGRLGRRARRLVPRHPRASARARTVRRPRARDAHDRLPHRLRHKKERDGPRRVLIDALRASTTPAARIAGSHRRHGRGGGRPRRRRPRRGRPRSPRRAGARSWPHVDRHPGGAEALDGVETVEVKVVWDPPGRRTACRESARAKLAMPLEELEPYRSARSAA